MPRKVNGLMWPKGVSGNPKGKTPLPLEIREFRKASKQDIIEEFKYLWNMTEPDLTAIKDDPTQPIIRVAIAKKLLGNDLDGVLNRVHGMPKEEIDINGSMSFHSKIVHLAQEIESGNGKELISENKNQEFEEKND